MTRQPVACAQDLPPAAGARGDDPRRALAAALEHAAHRLPDQAPLEFFVHHNTLHAFEGLPFERAVEAAAREFDAEPWLTEAEYREALARGRILPEDVEVVLARSARPGDLEAEVGLGLTRRELRRGILLLGLEDRDGAALTWAMQAEGLARALRRDVPEEARRRTLALTRQWLEQLGKRGLAALEEVLAFGGAPGIGPLVEDLGVAPDLASLREALEGDGDPLAIRALWVACLDVTATHPEVAAPRRPARPRDLLLAATGVDADDLVRPKLVRYVSAFLDQGVASWPMPGREAGLFPAVLRLLVQDAPLLDACWRPLAAEARALGTEDPEVAALALLDDLGVGPGDYEDFVTRALLVLPGWAGMVHRLERFPDQALRSRVPERLVDFLALLLLLERRACRHVAAAELGYPGPLAGLAGVVPAGPLGVDPRQVERRAFHLFQVAQLAGASAAELREAPAGANPALLDELATFDGWTRRRLLHQAYERRLELEALDLVAHAYPGIPPGRPATPPAAQLFFCIDDREESLRRHLEEVRPDFETFGVAGFYAIAMAFRGHGQARAFPACPVAVVPAHAVEERPEDAGKRPATSLVVRLARALQLEAGSILEGWLAAAVFGLGLFIPLVLRIASPRLAARLRRALNGLALGRGPRRFTSRLEDGATDAAGRPLGFDLATRVAVVRRVLEDSGLVAGFAPLVLVLGHGSTTRNNPHEAGYRCGACSGKDGGPNARLFAEFANEPAVREALAARGLAIPAGTWFVGGEHDTTSDRLDLYDLDLVPASHQPGLAAARAALDEARARDAHERIRRLGTAPRGLDPAAALRYVEGRSESLNEPQPEYGHSTNAFCFVGRRAWSRGLFLDRRAFLASYDPGSDPDGSVLERVLATVGPVGADINLHYFFSRMDNRRYGAGTKLPHNIAGLLGVVNGATGDLRTGLAHEMVDIHEPVRLLIVVEATPTRLEAILDRQEALGRLVRNAWVHLACVHPDTGRVHRYEDGRFVAYEPSPVEPPRAPSSMAWYAGSRVTLPLAVIAAGSPEVAGG